MSSLHEDRSEEQEACIAKYYAQKDPELNRKPTLKLFVLLSHLIGGNFFNKKLITYHRSNENLTHHSNYCQTLHYLEEGRKHALSCNDNYAAEEMV